MLFWMVLGGCSSGPCDSGELKKVADAVAMVDARQRQQVAAMGLTEACTLPAPVIQGLNGVANGFPDSAALVDMRVAADAPELWLAACPGGPRTLAEAMRLAGPDARRKVHQECKLDRYGWGPDSFAKANGPLVLTVILAHELRDASAFSRDLTLNALAGL